MIFLLLLYEKHGLERIVEFSSLCKGGGVSLFMLNMNLCMISLKSDTDEVESGFFRALWCLVERMLLLIVILQRLE